jgi:hypothetical protein
MSEKTPVTRHCTDPQPVFDRNHRLWESKVAIETLKEEHREAKRVYVSTKKQYDDYVRRQTFHNIFPGTTDWIQVLTDLEDFVRRQELNAILPRTTNWLRETSRLEDYVRRWAFDNILSRTTDWAHLISGLDRDDQHNGEWDDDEHEPHGEDRYYEWYDNSEYDEEYYEGWSDATSESDDPFWDWDGEPVPYPAPVDPGELLLSATEKADEAAVPGVIECPQGLLLDSWSIRRAGWDGLAQPNSFRPFRYQLRPSAKTSEANTPKDFSSMDLAVQCQELFMYNKSPWESAHRLHLPGVVTDKLVLEAQMACEAAMMAEEGLKDPFAKNHNWP